MKNRKLLIARIILTVLTVTAVAAIFYNSSLSAVESTEQSSPLTDAINSFLVSVRIPLTLTEKMIRKIAHFIEYSALGALLTATVHLYTRKRGQTLMFVLPIGVLVAVCDELIQLSSAGRSCEVRDMVIDFSGIVFAALIVILLISILKKRIKKKQLKEG